MAKRAQLAAANTAAAETHTDNMTKLAELEELGQRLAVPELAEEINELVPEATLECRPFSWTPYAPAIIDPSLSARNGLMAIRGWAMAPKENGLDRLGMFVGLYHEKLDEGDDPRGLKPMTLSRHVMAADNMLNTVEEYGFPSSYVPPTALNTTSCVYQSWKSLDDIQQLFSPDSFDTTRRRRSKTTVKATAGVIAANATLVIDSNVAYNDLRDKADKFYDEAQNEL